MSKKVAIVILDQFADWEGAFLSTALLDKEFTEGNRVYWVSTDIQPKKSLGGMRVLPDFAIEDLPDSFDALILIGGNSWRTDDAQKIVPAVRRFRELNKAVGFICDAAYFAAREGFLNDVAHTGNDPEEMSGLETYTNAQQFRQEAAVRDGHVITANGNDPVAFAAEVLRELEVMPAEQIDMWQDFYSLGYWNALRKYGYLSTES